MITATFYNYLFNSLALLQIYSNYGIYFYDSRLIIIIKCLFEFKKYNINIYNFNDKITC